MKLILVVLTLAISATCRNLGGIAGSPVEQSDISVVESNQTETTEPTSPSASSAALSPWSAWMNLKAPPVAFLKPKKKPFPPLIGSGIEPSPPAAGETEAPWVAWTKLKVPPTFVSATVPKSPAAESVEAPWVSWTNLKVPLAMGAKLPPQYYAIPPSASSKPSAGPLALSPYDSQTPQTIEIKPESPMSPTESDTPEELLKSYLENMFSLKLEEKEKAVNFPSSSETDEINQPMTFSYPPSSPFEVPYSTYQQPSSPLLSPYQKVIPAAYNPVSSGIAKPVTLVGRIPLSKAPQPSPSILPEEIPSVLAWLQAKKLNVKPVPPTKLSFEEIVEKATPEEKALLLNPAVIEYITSKVQDETLPALNEKPISVAEIFEKATPEEKALLLNPAVIEYIKSKVQDETISTKIPMTPSNSKLSVEEIFEKSTPSEKALLLNPAVIAYIKSKVPDETVPVLNEKPVVPRPKLSVEEIFEKATPAEKALLLNPAVIEYIKSKVQDETALPKTPTTSAIPLTPTKLLVAQIFEKATPAEKTILLNPAVIEYINSIILKDEAVLSKTSSVPVSYPSIKPIAPEVYQNLYPWIAKPTPIFPIEKNMTSQGLAVAEDKLLVKWAKTILEMQKNNTLAPTKQKSLIESAWIDWLKLHNLTISPSGNPQPIDPAKTPTVEEIKELIQWLEIVGGAPVKSEQVAEFIEWLGDLEAAPVSTELPTLVAPASPIWPTPSPQSPTIAPIAAYPTYFPALSILELQKLGIFPVPTVPSKVPEVPTYPIETINEIMKTAPPEVKAYLESILLANNIIPTTPGQEPSAYTPIEPERPNFILPTETTKPFPVTLEAWIQANGNLPPVVKPPKIPTVEITSSIEAINEIMKTAPPELKAKWESILSNNAVPVTRIQEPYPLFNPVEANTNAPSLFVLKPEESTTPLPATSSLAEWIQENIPPKILETATSIPVENEIETATPMAGLEELTPVQFSILLKKILEQCNKTTLMVPRSTSAHRNHGNHESSEEDEEQSPTANMKRALYPSQSLGLPSVSPTPGAIQSKLDLVPQEFWDMVPTVAPNTTILDPGYWAAKKSMFISKLFDALARVTLNYTDSATTTETPKQKLMKQIDTVLLSDAARSIKGKEEDSAETSTDDEDLINSDEPENLPKEPENPLHKLFKFGVQKTILSDISTTIAPLPTTAPTVPTTPTVDKQKILLDKLKAAYRSSKKHNKKSKKTKSKSKSKKFRKSTTTVGPIDFEELAKALLVQPSK